MSFPLFAFTAVLKGMTRMKYIHYGSSRFDRKKFQPIENQGYRTKPLGGFWASSENSVYSWKTWCETEEMGWCDGENFAFHIRDTANVIHIKNVEDLSNLPTCDSLIYGVICLDFEKMLTEGIDAVELHLSDAPQVNSDLLFSLYGWDCDSILIMNPEIILQEGRIKDEVL